MDCKVCGAWFSSSNPKTELCSSCERALKRLNGYAVPVVRCKDCKYYNHEYRWCPYLSSDTSGYSTDSVDMSPEDFCSYGERKDDG